MRRPTRRCGRHRRRLASLCRFLDIDAAWERYDELDRVVDAASLKIEGVLVLKKGGDGTRGAEAHRPQRAPGPEVGRRGGRGARVCCSAVDHWQRRVLGAAGAGIGGLQKRHHRKELAEELTDAIDLGHSGLVLLVSDPAAVELQQALAKADHIVRKAVDKAAAEEIKAEAEAAQATADDPAKT